MLLCEKISCQLMPCMRFVSDQVSARYEGLKTAALHIDELNRPSNRIQHIQLSNDLRINA